MEESYEFMNILSIEEAVKIAYGKKVIIITGVTGQDGSLMADYLLKNTDYELFGGARRLSVNNHENIDHLEKESRFHLINFDLTDAQSITQIINQLKPHYFINFAAQSFVKSSWDFPVQTWETNTTSMIHILEAIRQYSPTCRFYNAGSSEEFGNVIFTPQNETHPLRPRSPYGASKAAARQIVKVYRDSYGLYALQGWLFNHEGTRRGDEFVTRKITKGVARVVEELKSAPPKTVPEVVPIELGNLDAKRDWSDAEDCVIAVWKMLNQEAYNKNIPAAYTFPKYMTDASGYFKEELVPNVKEYIVASGESHSIREFIEESFRVAGIEGRWFINTKNDPLTERFTWYDGWVIVPDVVLAKVNPIYYRPAEVDALCGDASLVRKELGWEPKTDFKNLVRKMILNDMK